MPATRVSGSGRNAGAFRITTSNRGGYPNGKESYCAYQAAGSCRQGYARTADRPGPRPVSYTHLDVYKRQASESANTVDEYKTEIREKLEKQAENRAETAFENEVIEKVCENAQVDIPDAMIEDQIDSMLRDMEMRMMYQGMKLDDYFKYTGQTLSLIHI